MFVVRFEALWLLAFMAIRSSISSSPGSAAYLGHFRARHHQPRLVLDVDLWMDSLNHISKILLCYSPFILDIIFQTDVKYPGIFIASE